MSELFSDKEKKKEKTLAPPGHPIHTLMEEHKILLQFTEKLKNVAKEIKETKDSVSLKEKQKKLSNIAEHFKESEKHYLREENVLFPYLEKHGITQPPAIMWSEHDKIRKEKGRLYELSDLYKGKSFQEFIKTLEELAKAIGDMLSSHFSKENNILFPTALEVIAANEWEEIREQCDELGYCCFTPEYSKKIARPEEKSLPRKVSTEKGKVFFETGELSVKELETILNTLPVDITFVDKEDRVRYFSQSKDRIFPRTKAVIGRRVQQCHPQKSLHVVEQILSDFKNNESNVAEFWISLKGRLVYIRYFAVRDEDQNYLGCLEVTQDITKVKEIKGEKRLL